MDFFLAIADCIFFINLSLFLSLLFNSKLDHKRSADFCLLSIFKPNNCSAHDKASFDGSWLH